MLKYACFLLLLTIAIVEAGRVKKTLCEQMTITNLQEKRFTRFHIAEYYIPEVVYQSVRDCIRLPLQAKRFTRFHTNEYYKPRATVPVVRFNDKRTRIADILFR